MSTPEKSIREQVWGAVDPAAENRDLINAAVHGTQVPNFLQRIGVDIGDSWAEMHHLGLEFRRSVERIEAAVQVLVPRGWAVMTMDTAVVAEAVRLVRSGQELEADDLLAGQWEGDGSWRMDRIVKRIAVMGAADPDLPRLFQERARLVGLARDHHLAGRYDASVPLLLAHLEGIAIDVTGGKKFFTKSQHKADVVDPTQLVSIESALAALQATYGENVEDTQTEGSLSRHGVLHGRELAYDTRLNSAKTWSVMDALVEWALPKARDVVAGRRAERQQANAGSEELDERGRRVDDREFAETRQALRKLDTAAMGWHRQRGSFRGDLVGVVYDADDFVRCGLPAEHGTQQLIRADGQEVAYWRETTSGWALGIDLVWDGEHFLEYLYAAPEAPGGLATEGVAGWGALWDTPPDWT